MLWLRVAIRFHIAGHFTPIVNIITLKTFLVLLKKLYCCFIDFRCALQVDVTQTPRFGIDNNLENESNTFAPTFSDLYNQV
jgi:hypothetical protein